ncbi:uncharacterized protein A4U43_C09F11640 [Asparagus officinalis]|uniref:AP2/ERF domain-containing protein n=1 Tax=Asparagus officinalis TaxID=4686 RepID=A0A5P1E7D7_ASPOF|nr:ethylene-responsive transcription factor-like protein At4g13040 isoform X2 [Asparagus officinalis]ONK58379.1 uncharacterized protein A4U43_C09F11640 [Asparagus officinalis]
MVSLRRRRLLGLCSGRNSVPVQLPGSTENGSIMENSNKTVKPFSVHPLPSFILSHQKPTNISEASFASSNASASSSSKEDTGKKVKRRKRHRRKHYEDQEPCIMRGVYFKNMKWQAAIKVDKKQIHLGTVGSQEEAARLYDRAAFMCGREPNFELSEEEKRELSQYKWEEFLTLTRNAINIKKHQRRIGVRGRPRKTEVQNSNYDPERGTGVSSMSDDDEDEETSAT